MIFALKLIILAIMNIVVTCVFDTLLMLISATRLKQKSVC